MDPSLHSAAIGNLIPSVCLRIWLREELGDMLHVDSEVSVRI